MDRRSWLWRRKSSEKSPGETESSGGSVSSHSERYSDDQVYSNQSSQSPEITSKAEPPPEELEGGVKILSEKLSTALLNISVKDDLVKQHSKVAEEAVEGWEKAESEVLALRQQVEVLTLRNSTLEDRVCHLDGALKECLRQLRQTREEKDQKVDEAIEKKTSEWQITKSELEQQLADLRSQLQSAKTTETSLTSIEMVQKENSALKLELASMAEELEIRFIERELSNQAAEQASKLHLESVKKATKFEAECHRLNSALQKALATNDRRSFTNNKSVAESEDSKETYESERNRTTPSVMISLMDDFLEMERLVALPESDPRDSVKEAMVNRGFEVEEMLKRVKTKKVKLEITLNERENELKASRSQLKNAETKLVEMKTLLIAANGAREMTEKELESTKAKVKALQERVKGGESKLVKVQNQLDMACSERREAESQLDSTYAKKKEAESRCKALETELESLLLKVESLETDVEKERTLSEKMGAKCCELEGEISRLQHENQHPKAAIRNVELRMKQDTELALAGSKFADCQKTISSLSWQLKTLATLEDFLIDTNEFSRRI